MTGTFYPPTTYDPAAGTGQLLCNPPFTPMTSPFKPGDYVLMRNRVRDDVVKVLAVTDRSVVVEGTKANFHPTTGMQTTFDNCWPGWRIEPLEVQP